MSPETEERLTIGHNVCETREGPIGFYQHPNPLVTYLWFAFVCRQKSKSSSNVLSLGVFCQRVAAKQPKLPNQSRGVGRAGGGHQWSSQRSAFTVLSGGPSDTMVAIEAMEALIAMQTKTP